MSQLKTVCRGECCRNPFGVCHHQRTCDYHLAEAHFEAVRSHGRGG